MHMMADKENILSVIPAETEHRIELQTMDVNNVNDKSMAEKDINEKDMNKKDVNDSNDNNVADSSGRRDSFFHNKVFDLADEGKEANQTNLSLVMQSETCFKSGGDDEKRIGDEERLSLKVNI